MSSMPEILEGFSKIYVSKIHLQRPYSRTPLLKSSVEISKEKMANNTAADLPPEAIAFATQMYDAARAGRLDIFQQALPAGLPANMTNEKGDSLVC